MSYQKIDWNQKIWNKNTLKAYIRKINNDAKGLNKYDEKELKTLAKATEKANALINEGFEQCIQCNSDIDDCDCDRCNYCYGVQEECNCSRKKIIILKTFLIKRKPSLQINILACKIKLKEYILQAKMTFNNESLETDILNLCIAVTKKLLNIENETFPTSNSLFSRIQQEPGEIQLSIYQKILEYLGK